jgi:hypothetical protein
LQTPPQDAIPFNFEKQNHNNEDTQNRSQRATKKAKETIGATEISEPKERNYKRRKESEPGTLPGNAHVKIWGELSLVEKKT